MVESNKVTLDTINTGNATFADAGASDGLTASMNAGAASSEVEQELQASKDFSAMLKGQSFSDGITYAGSMKEGAEVTSSNTPAQEKEAQQYAYR